MANDIPQRNSLHFCPGCGKVLIWIDGDSYCDNVDCTEDSFPDEEEYEHE